MEDLSVYGVTCEDLSQEKTNRRYKLYLATIYKYGIPIGTMAVRRPLLRGKEQQEILIYRVIKN